MSYMRRGNPYNAYNNIPRYVIEEDNHRAITSPGLPRRTIGAPQPPPIVSPGLPRRTVMPLPPLDFQPATGRIYPSGTYGRPPSRYVPGTPPPVRPPASASLNGLGSLGDFNSGGSLGRASGGGSLGPMAGRRRVRGRRGLGADPLPACPPYAPPGTSGCIPVSTFPTGGTITVTNTGTRSSVPFKDAQAYYDDMKAAGQKSVKVPDYTLSSSEAAAYSRRMIGPGQSAMTDAQTRTAAESGSTWFKIIGSHWVTYNKNTRTLKIFMPSDSIVQDVYHGTTNLVGDVLSAIKNLGCSISDNALIQAAVSAAPAGTPARNIAVNLCGQHSQLPPVLPPPVTGGGMSKILLIGAAAAAALFLSRHR